jgi:hypothetical protein
MMMSMHHDDGVEFDRIELTQEVDAHRAAQVKGGFDPKPEPPNGYAPIIRFLINPAEIRG